MFDGIKVGRANSVVFQINEIDLGWGDSDRVFGR